MIISRGQLKELVERPRELGVSIYMPTHRVTEFQQDPIRLKNLLRQAEDVLAGNGMRPTVARQMLDPVRKLLPDNIFWEHQSDGLAIFVSPKMVRYYRLPLAFEEQVVAGQSFYIKPLLPIFASDGLFYVMALSQKGVRLLQCTRDSLRSVAPESLPSGMAEAMNFDGFERRVQLHSAATAVRGRGSVIFHGNGGASSEDIKKDMLRFFKIVDHGVHEVFKEEQAPLVLAAVDYLHPLYREVNSYAGLLEKGVGGNPDDLTDQDLHDRAWPVVESSFEECRLGALRKYREASGTELATAKLDDIVAAAYDGRVYLLFVAADKQAWGTFDPTGRAVTFHESVLPGDDDLLDFAAVRTLFKKGGVYVVKSGEVPGGSLAAAVLRY